MQRPAEITKQELMHKIKALGTITKDQRNSVICSLIGHSRIVQISFGYYYCGRCRDQIGDGLASFYDDSNKVIIGHNCEKCKGNFKTLTWQDKLYAPKNPLEQEAWAK